MGGFVSEDKDIRFSEKKVDESWKDQVKKEMSKDQPQSQTPRQQPSSPANSSPGARKEGKTSQALMNLIGSLGFQVMVQLGEIPSPDGVQRKPNMEAAKEIIDILVALKEKTVGNLNPEEQENLYSIVTEAQMKFAQKL